MNQQPAQHGFSLIETLVAVTILLFAIIGPMSIASQSIKSATYARENLTAVFLAQEGISSAVRLRNADALDGGGTWDWYSNLDSSCTNSSQGCDINPRDHSQISCATIADCRLSFDDGALESNERGFYNHDGDGVESPYTRVLRFSQTQPGEVEVLSTVSWTSSAFGTVVAITQTTHLFDHHD